MFKKFFLVTMSLVMLFTFGISPSTNQANAAEDNIQLDILDVTTVTNLKEALSKYNLTMSDITSSYSFEETQGVINLYDSLKDIYITFYVNNKVVEFQSIQKELKNGNVTFDLYTFNLEKAFSEEITSTGDLVDKGGISLYAKKPNKAALKWACIFSSYLACLGVAAAAGAAGTLVSGPFGAAAGFAGGTACRYVFQTLVEKYGSKDQACKILS